MPGRLIIAFILTFFISMVGWECYRNRTSVTGAGPQLKPSLELAAEDGTTSWKISYNKNRLGDATTHVVKTTHGVYQLRQEVMLDGDLESFLGPLSIFAKRAGINFNDFRVRLSTDMELTYLGTMRKLIMNFRAEPKPSIVIPGSAEELKQKQQQSLGAEKEETGNTLLRLYIVGETLISDELSFKGNLAFAGFKYPISDVKVKYRSHDSFFNNIVPTDCLANLRLGQTWQTPVIDPTQLMFGALATSEAKKITNGAINTDDLVKTKVIEVRVLDELRELDWNNTKVPCFVIQSNEKGSKMQIWVNSTTYRVLKQTAESDRYQLDMVREPKKVE